MSDEANILGKGREILLPPQGNPFDRNKDREPMAKTGAIPADEPQDLSPADLVARFARPDPAPMGAIGDEPMDLTPEDLAARFPSHHDDRNKIPGMGDGEPVGPSLPPQPSMSANAPPRRITGKMDEAMVEPTASAIEPTATAEAVIDDDQPIISAESPMPDFVADAPAAEAEAVLDDQPITSTEAQMPDAVAEAVAAMPAVEPTAPAMPDVAPVTLPERITMAETTPTSSSETGAARGEASPPPETVAPPAPAAGFQPYNPFASTQPALPSVASDFAVAQPVSTTPDDFSTQDAGRLNEGVGAAQPGKGEYAMPPVMEEESMVEKLITDERVDQLWQRIDNAEKQAVSDDSSLPHQRTANLENLKAARNLLLGGRRNYEDAVRYVVEVEADILYSGRVRRWSYSYGWFLVVYDIAWLVLLALGVVSGSAIAQRFAIGDTLLTPTLVLTIWVTIISGGLGGVSKSIFSLAAHVSKQDFDRQHLLWYITSPLMGAVMGVFVVMVAQIGIFTLSGGSTAGGSAVYLLYILGWLAGFQQNVALKLVDQAVELLLKPGEKKP
ncbi:MAG: hypothetical protein HYZ49_04690 [Chloroflexi bacterium]|nr:hypothetical protein [Chloroflexota bacterium]